MLYLDIKRNCKICNGSGITKYIGNDCHKCLKEIDLKNLCKFQLKDLKDEINILLKKKG